MSPDHVSSNGAWDQTVVDGALVAVALHNGHGVRDEIAGLLALDRADRLREEDPHTGEWASIASTRVVGRRSRFEVDLNRPRDKAVYGGPKDAWGLNVWKRQLPDDVVARSLAVYDAFYGSMHELLSVVEQRHGRFVVFDLHSYNHRRGGPTAPHDGASENPQVNVGTGSMNRSRWGRVVDRFMNDLRAHDFPGGPLDVRENVRFQGGHFSQWVHETFPDSGCALAIEFKKFFMDEWTGEPDRAAIAAIRDALQSTVAGVLEELALA